MAERGLKCWVTEAAALMAPLLGLCSPAFAQEHRELPAIVVFGDGSRDWMAEIQRFADFLDPHDRPAIVAGHANASFPLNATLVWFGDLSHEPSETAGAPEALRVVADHLGRDVRDGSAGLAKGEVRLGANCYTQSIDRADDLPEISINFSGEGYTRSQLRATTASNATAYSRQLSACLKTAKQPLHLLKVDRGTAASTSAAQ